jgi:hypothetical protein
VTSLSGVYTGISRVDCYGISALRSRSNECGRSDARCARLANKTRTIVGGSVYVNGVSVLFDGNKSPATIHREYVEVLLPAWEGQSRAEKRQ